MLRLDIDLFSMFVLLIYHYVIPFAGVVYGLVLLFLGIRAIWSRQPNGLLVSILVIGTLFAWFLPEPPMREEIKFFFYRSRYEAFIEQARPRYLAGDRICSKMVYEKYRDLSLKCPYAMSNSVEFTIYPGTFSLAYSFDKKKPEAPYCIWNGDVWKQIDENWYICKRLSD